LNEERTTRKMTYIYIYNTMKIDFKSVMPKAPTPLAEGFDLFVRHGRSLGFFVVFRVLSEICMHVSLYIFVYRLKILEKLV
jgi:hypothetical protein